MSLPRLTQEEIDSKAYSYLVKNLYMRKAKLRDIMRKYILLPTKMNPIRIKLALPRLKLIFPKLMLEIIWTIY